MIKTLSWESTSYGENVTDKNTTLLVSIISLSIGQVKSIPLVKKFKYLK